MKGGFTRKPRRGFLEVKPAASPMEPPTHRQPRPERSAILSGSHKNSRLIYSGRLFFIRFYETLLLKLIVPFISIVINSKSTVRNLIRAASFVAVVGFSSAIPSHSKLAQSSSVIGLT